jgi:hypothetical protein
MTAGQEYTKTELRGRSRAPRILQARERLSPSALVNGSKQTERHTGRIPHPQDISESHSRKIHSAEQTVGTIELVGNIAGGL